MTAPAFRLLCCGLSLYQRPDRAQAFRDLATSGNIVWEDFVATASAHQLAGVFHHAIETFGLGAALPAGIVEYFDGIATLCRQRNDGVRREAIELAELLNEIGVSPIFLKGGGHLLCDLYPDRAMRVMVDLDVLVPPDSVAACATRLAEAGFETLSDYRDPKSHQHAPLGRPGAAASVELHHEVLAFPYGRILTADDARREAEAIDIGGPRAAILSLPHRIVHNIAHAQLMDHAYVYGVLRPRELFDFVLLAHAMGSEPDWAPIESRLDTHGYKTAFDFHLLAAEHLLGWSTPARRRGMRAKCLYARAAWQAGRPWAAKTSIRLLRPLMLMKRELSDPALRQRLRRNLRDPAWYRRQWRMLRGRKPD